MEFQLPQTLAEKLTDYDQILKSKKPAQQQNNLEVEDKYLKRKSRLAFPCPDIFYDLPLDLVHEIYEEFCSVSVSYRHRLVHTKQPVQTLTHLVVWYNYTTSDDERVQRWYCWKLGNINCPITLREWGTEMKCDEYKETCADTSFRDFRYVTDNPFSLRYKKEKNRYRKVSHFFDQAKNMIGNSLGKIECFNPFDVYTSHKFFYQKHFSAKSENEFYVTKWLAHQDLFDFTSRKNDIKTMSLIVNSKFYQTQIRKEIEDAKANMFSLGRVLNTNTIMNKLCYVYLFLYVFPDEYDRSINLYQMLSKFSFGSASYSWGVFNDAIRYHGSEVGKFINYFRDRITPQMFMNWILEEAEIKQKRAYDTTIRDTVEMMETVYRRTAYMINVNPELTKEPKRWRLLDTHDHYSGIILQMNNNLKKLPTDLIPEPIELSTNLGNIKLFQPATNHEVIRWGKAVCNCVGSAGYDERVLSHQAFLVFAERNGKPWVTSLLTLRGGLLQVGQTVSPFNNSLKQEEMEVYHDCLGKILTEQEI